MQETPSIVNGKTLAEEMAEQDRLLSAAMAVQNAEVETPKVEISEELTIDSIEAFFIDEGQWLEGQIAADTDAHQNCPVCSLMLDVFKTLSGALQDSLENLDELQYKKIDEAVILAILKRDRAWYLASKQIAMRLYEEGHAPRNVINAHPELHSLGAAKKKRSSDSKKKQKHKNARVSRRKNR